MSVNYPRRHFEVMMIVMPSKFTHNGRFKLNRYFIKITPGTGGSVRCRIVTAFFFCLQNPLGEVRKHKGFLPSAIIVSTKVGFIKWNCYDNVIKGKGPRCHLLPRFALRLSVPLKCVRWRVSGKVVQVHHTVGCGREE